MKKLKSLGGLVLAALSAATGMANAAITGPTSITFGTGTQLPAAVFGQANATPRDAAGDCAAPYGDCYYENGFVVGVVQDTSAQGSTAHLHRAGLADNRMIMYHADSSGIFVRAVDGTAFSFNAIDFHAPIQFNDPPNPDQGPNDYWEILGFSTAVNPALDSGDGTNYATRVAYQQVANGFDGVLQLSSNFKNIKSLWIHYKGHTQVPTDGKDFSMAADNIQLSAAVVDPSVAINCLFNWAEKNYANLFSPAGQATANWNVYTYRYYPSTHAYLGVSSADKHVYYLAPDGNMNDVGALSYWLPFVGCQ